MEYLIAFVALTAMEIVLGIDNIVFIAIVSAQLPETQRAKARRLGLGLALVSRILLLLTLSVIMKLTTPLFHFQDLGIPAAWLSEHANAVSCKDLILFFGGLFLIWKSVFEVHKKLDGGPEEHDARGTATMRSVLMQIAVLDVIFSLDSVITAVGMVKSDGYTGLAVMISAIIVAVIVMLIFAGTVSDFIEKNPTLKMLALSFLILIGVMLVAEGVGSEFDKGYIYFAMAFAMLVESLNMRMRYIKTKKRAAQ